MPVTVQPYNDDPTILIYEYIGDWTTDDFRIALAHVAELINALPWSTRVDGVSCFEQSTRSLIRVNPFELLACVKQDIPDRRGVMVLVFSHPLAASVLSITNSFFSPDQRRIFQAGSLDDAIALIHRERGIAIAH